MQLKFIKTVIEPQVGPSRIGSIAWSSDSSKLAVSTSDRLVLLFDENGERRDKFSTKPVDAKFGKKSYVVKDLAWSPDSTRLAVAQSDQILFVYKIGRGWSEKKVICNKFAQQSAVTCLAWPSELGVVLGLADGKVRLANVTSNRASTLYATDVHVIALAVSPDRKAIVSGHADGSIVRFALDGGNQSKLCTNPSPPYALAWTAHALVAAGCDRRVISYGVDGRVMQQFDYSRETEKEFTVAAVSPSGLAFVVGSFDRIRLFNWNSRRGAWDEGGAKEIRNLYTITALAWKPDGSRLVAGSLCGGAFMFDCALKRSMIKNKFETTHVGPSQVIVKDVSSGKRVTVRAEVGAEIDDIKVMGRDRYVVAYTADSLLLGDLETGRTSEVAWQSSGNEKFYFDSENVCMIFNAGELSLVEYGTNQVLASVRTEFMNPHLLSVRLNERRHKGAEPIKRMAFLLDLKTIDILDLMFGSSLTQVAHDSKIDWLELNETGRKLLFRDKRSRLHLFDVESEQKATLLSFCSFVQWVPASDVAVAQSRDNLCVWYNVDAPDQTTMFPMQGDVEAVVRDDGQTSVVVREGSQQVAYTLDEGLIEFGTALDDADLARAVVFLEQLDDAAAAESMWRQLARVALRHRQLAVAQRCFAALGDVARVRYLAQTQRIARTAADRIGGDGAQFYQVRARLAVMARDFKEAEKIYLEQNCLDEAIAMYQSMHKWTEAMELAESRGHPDIEGLKAKYYRHLADTNQNEKAAEVKVKEGDPLAAIDLFLKDNLPARAARVIAEHETLLNNTELIQTVAVALIKSELFDKAGELFEKVKDFDRALECYRRGHAFAKAVELARYAFPPEVIRLEEEWGEWLMHEKQMDAAINHFIESGNTIKALDAAIRARQWNKAVQIVDVVEDTSLAVEHFGKIAEHYASVRDFERAERFFIEASMTRQAIEMYNDAGMWQEAHRLASESMSADDATDMYVAQAQQLEEAGRLLEAEQLYCAMQQPNRAIAMYKQAGDHDAMMRLVSQFHGDHVQDTHAHLAKDLEEQGRMKDAELHYLQANEWKSAVNMYRAAEQWEDAYRLAKQYGGDVAQKQVAYLWARSLGGDSAVKLLQKFNLLDESIDYATDNGAFDFAFEMCRLGLKSKMPSVHLKYALQLEEDNQLEQAEAQFLQAGKPKEAVLMYVHQQDWDNAQRLAERHCPEAIPEVYVGQARIAFEQQDYERAESYLLRAHKPEIIVKSYKELGKWSEALRVCKDYLPSLLPQLQDEYDQQQLLSGAKGAQSYLAQAKDWEAQGEYERAISCYLKINKPLTQDEPLMAKSWIKAGEMAAKFLPEEMSAELVQQAVALLQGIRRFTPAAELLLSIGSTRQAVDVFIAAAEWAKAKKIAVELEPQLEEYVDAKYKEYLKNEGKPEQLVDVDILGAIDMYIERGQWEKALDTVSQQDNKTLVDKYVALYATELIGANKFVDAIGVFEKYGSSANPQNFNVYKRLIDEIMALRSAAQTYSALASLRNVLHDVVRQLEAVGEQQALDERYLEVFGRYLLVSHYYATRAALLSTNDAALRLCALRLSVSLLRHADLLPVDKVFYEAGAACRDFGGRYEGMGFVFLNHYLDIAEAVEEQNAELIDNTVFEGTDIPLDLALPEQLHLSADEHEAVKEWVLAASVDKQTDRQLLLDKRGVFEASLVGRQGDAVPACLLSGYPILDARKQFGNSGLAANREDWNKLLLYQRVANSADIDDMQKFVAKWTQASISSLST